MVEPNIHAGMSDDHAVLFSTLHLYYGTLSTMFMVAPGYSQCKATSLQVRTLASYLSSLRVVQESSSQLSNLHAVTEECVMIKLLAQVAAVEQGC